MLQWAARLKPHGRRSPLVANSPAAALALADELARLIDDMTTRQVPGSELDELVPDELDDYWQLTLEFLQDRPQALAGDAGRARRDRAGGAPRPADRGGAQRGSRRTTAR